MSTQLAGDRLTGTTAPERGPGGMYVHESGTPGSPAIVFIHGLGQSGREWRRHMAKLAGFHCLAPDLPGFGRSNHLPLPSNERIADLLAELIESRVPARRAHVVGISWGALLTQVLMQRHPDRVDRAVADGLPLLWPRGSRPLMLWFITLVVPFLHTRPVMALFRDLVDAADLRLASRLAYWKVWAVGLPNLTAVTEAPCPTLLVAGEKEGSVRPGDAALVELMPHAEAWYAPGLGHCWQRKDPELHIRMLEAWFTGQELPSELRREPAPSAAIVERLRSDVRAQGGMFVEESGTPGSPAIVFIHGAGQSGRIWREHMERLNAFHCLAPDLPGFGRSNRLPSASLSETADLVAELIATRVPTRRANVVGISSGAVVIHALLDRHADRVERAIIDGAPVLLPRGVRGSMLLSTIVLSPFVHTRPVINGLREHRDEEDVRASSRRAFRRSVVDSFQSFAAIGAPCPTLLVAGEKETDDFSGMGVRSSNAALAALMPQATAMFAPGLGHCWQRKDPELHIRMLEAWFSGQELPSELRREPEASAEVVERLRREVSATRRGEMYVHESGTPGSPAIVFVHGAGQSGREWRGHMERLAGFHCLAPDLPGFGRSNRLEPVSKERIADLVAELIETRVPARRASVVGISSGGMVIHALLDRHPDRVERAIIDGSPPYHAPRVGRGLMRLFMTALSPFIHTRPVMALFRESHDPADLRAASRRAFRRGIAECFTTFAAIGAPCPTLLVAGEKESRVRPSNAALAALMPHAEAWFAPGLDHCWQRKTPDLHIRMLEAWFTGQELPSELRREPPPPPEAVERLRREVPAAA